MAAILWRTTGQRVASAAQAKAEFGKWTGLGPKRSCSAVFGLAAVGSKSGDVRELEVKRILSNAHQKKGRSFVHPI